MMNTETGTRAMESPARSALRSESVQAFAGPAMGHLLKGLFATPLK